jgi:iron complex outermembrane receptor protein
MKQPKYSMVCMRALLIFAAGAPLSMVDAAQLEHLVVKATRVEKQIQRVPLAVSSVTAADVQRTQQMSLDESMNKIPGVFFQNRYNVAQDSRVSIRGFGARANFGIRGIKLFVDGIPVTVADGQTADARFDFGSVDRIEVIRGPASALYGASSGGVISVYTEDGPDIPFMELSTMFGEFDFNKYQVKAGGDTGSLNYLVNISNTSSKGYREHSRTEYTQLNSKFRYTFSDGSELTFLAKDLHVPTAEDPGGLTAAQRAADLTAAQFNNIRFNAGEDFDEQRIGWIYDREFGVHHFLSLRNYVTWRAFDSRLPFGIPFGRTDGVVQFDRFFIGGGVQYSYDGDMFGHANRFTTGVDIDSQEDDRQRYENSTKGIIQDLTLDQIEQADAVGIFFQNEFSITDTVELVVGGRYDMIDLDVHDKFLANGNQSEKVEFDEFSPMVGLVWSVRPEINFYANYATAFETPSFGELANPAISGTAGGFGDVNAQTATSYEVGLKGTFADRIRYDVAVFTADVDDEIISTNCDANRCFFDNADTERTGVEVGLEVSVFEGLDLTTTYTYSDFNFSSFPASPAINDNRLPGIPEHQFFAELAYTHPSGLYVKWDMLHVEEFFADNANTVINGSYNVSNLRFGRDFVYGEWRFSPFFGVNNLFDEDYNQNVRLNEGNTRYFEPAPDRNVYGGINIRYTFGT